MTGPRYAKSGALLNRALRYAKVGALLNRALRYAKIGALLKRVRYGTAALLAGY